MNYRIEDAKPSANLTINKSRVKVYNKDQNPTIYLNAGTEFQIELHNPKQNTVLAKIKLNGNYISQGGVVLKPGQRVFLERYLDNNRKFLFDIYEVDNTQENKHAIEKNGDLTVEFYDEYITPIFYSNVTTTNGSHWTTDYNNLNTTISFLCNSTFSSSDNIVGSLANNTKSIETGRVEKGSESNQNFNIVDTVFNTWISNSVTYKLLPISQKINDSRDINIKQYCTNCGCKLKKEYKYCPVCATKV